MDSFNGEKRHSQWKNIKLQKTVKIAKIAESKSSKVPNTVVQA